MRQLHPHLFQLDEDWCFLIQFGHLLLAGNVQLAQSLLGVNLDFAQFLRPLHFGAALGKGDFRFGQPFGALHGHFLLGNDDAGLFHFHFGQARRGRFRPCCFGSGLGGNGCLFGGAGLRFGAGQFGTGLGRGLNLQRFGFGLGLHPNGFGRLPLLHQRNFLHPLRFF